jgi:DNA-binding GntR family transcriptional regulator
MDQAVKGDNAHDFHHFNLKFHDRLLELAGNAKLTATYRKLVNELSLFRRQNLTSESMAVYAREHRQIVKAIAGGDPEAAGQAMYQHVMNSRERTQRNYAQKKLAEAQALGSPKTAAPLEA